MKATVLLERELVAVSELRRGFALCFDLDNIVSLKKEMYI